MQQTGTKDIRTDRLEKEILVKHTLLCKTFKEKCNLKIESLMSNFTWDSVSPFPLHTCWSLGPKTLSQQDNTTATNGPLSLSTDMWLGERFENRKMSSAGVVQKLELSSSLKTSSSFDIPAILYTNSSSSRARYNLQSSFQYFTFTSKEGHFSSHYGHFRNQLVPSLHSHPVRTILGKSSGARFNFRFADVVFVTKALCCTQYISEEA